MKKLLLFIATLSAFAACTTDTTEDVAQIAVPDCLQVSIADEESRMQLSNEKTVWTEGDKVSVFYKSDANQCWKFNGKTGDPFGNTLMRKSGDGDRQNGKGRYRLPLQRILYDYTLVGQYRG